MLGNLLGGTVGEVVKTVADVAGEFFESPDEKREFKEFLLKQEDKMADRISKQNLAQMEVNKVEAAHRSIFVAGWRPALGWLGSISLGSIVLVTMIFAIVLACAVLWGMDATKVNEALDIFIKTTASLKDYIFEIVMVMLGGMGLRTYEKKKGVSK